MATITDYTKQTWVNNSTKISAENLNKIEEGLDALSSDAQQLASEFNALSSDVALLRSATENNSLQIGDITRILPIYEEDIDELESSKATKTELAGVNTPIGTASCSTDLTLGIWDPSFETPQLIELPPAQQFNVKLDLTFTYDSVNTSGIAYENLLKKKRKPLWQIIEDSSSSVVDAVGVGPGTVTLMTADELWANLTAKHSNASWENIKSDENNSVLGKPVDLNDDVIFAVYGGVSNVRSGIFATDKYDSNIDFILICYNQSLNKYYFVNLGDLSIGMSLKYSLIDGCTTSDGYGTCLAVEQTHVNWETIKLPSDTEVLTVAFMIKQSILEDLGISADEAFYYLGDWYYAECMHPYVFRMTGNGTYDVNYFALLETGTYYLPTDTISDYENTRSSYKIGNNYNGPSTSPDDLFSSPNWVSNFNNPKAVYKFTYPTSTSNAYKVLELCQKHTDDDIERIAKNTLNDLISFGSGDPTTSTDGMFYFKINGTD